MRSFDDANTVVAFAGCVSIVVATLAKYGCSRDYVASLSTYICFNPREGCFGDSTYIQIGRGGLGGGRRGRGGEVSLDCTDVRVP